MFSAHLNSARHQKSFVLWSQLFLVWRSFVRKQSKCITSLDYEFKLQSTDSSRLVVVVLESIFFQNVRRSNLLVYRSIVRLRLCSAEWYTSSKVYLVIFKIENIQTKEKNMREGSFSQYNLIVGYHPIEMMVNYKQSKNYIYSFTWRDSPHTGELIEWTWWWNSGSPRCQTEKNITF